MQKLIVKGKKKILGNIKISGSKNATLPILAASLLSNKIIMKDNNFFNIKQKRLYYFISFLNLMKFLYKFVNKY